MFQVLSFRLYEFVLNNSKARTILIFGTKLESRYIFGAKLLS